MTDGTAPRALDPMGSLMGGGRLRTPRPCGDVPRPPPCPILARLSLREKILVCAAETPGPQRIEDIAVACWVRFPAAFALRGHAEHVDAHKVFARFSGAEGLCALGFLRLVEARTYVVTPSGHRRARKLLRAVEMERAREKAKEKKRTKHRDSRQSVRKV